MTIKSQLNIKINLEATFIWPAYPKYLQTYIKPPCDLEISGSHSYNWVHSANLGSDSHQHATEVFSVWGLTKRCVTYL